MSDTDRPDDTPSDLEPIDLHETPETPDVKSVVVDEGAPPAVPPLPDDDMEHFGEVSETPVERKRNNFSPDDHVTMAVSPYGEAKKKYPANHTLYLLALGLEDINEVIADYQLDFSDTEQPLAKHIGRIKNIIANLSNTLQISYYKETRAREDADWQQDVAVDGKGLRAGRAALRSDADPVLKIRNELGLGELVQIPLWHSGIWITFKTPSDSALLALENRIALEKAALGRMSNGMVFSSVEVYSTSHLLDFIFEHVYTVNLPNKEPALLRDLILTTDIPQLVWGILLSIYPSGYPLAQPCVANPDECNHVVEAMINLGRLSWTDRNRLTERQKRHMVQRTAIHTVEKIREYQSEFVFKAQGSVEVNDKVSLRLRVPTIAQALDSGFAWVEGINNATQKAFSMKMGQNERDAYIQKQAMITSLRQYAHWFEAVVNTNAEGVESVIDDPAAIDEILEVICANNTMTDKAFKAVIKYINDCSITMIALPKWKCPKCQGVPDEAYLKHPQLIPLDVISVFFILRVQKVTGKLAAEQLRVQ